MLTDDDVGVAEMVTERLSSLMLTAAALPATLCHGDPGPPNLMFGPASDEPAFVDWQLVAARPGALDLAWLLVLGVPVDAYQHRRVAWLDRYRGGLGLDLHDFHRVYALGVAARGESTGLDGRCAGDRAERACGWLCRGDHLEGVRGSPTP